MNMKISTYGAIVAAVILLIGGLFIWKVLPDFLSNDGMSEDGASIEGNATATPGVLGDSDQYDGYTVLQVAAHNNESSCWTIIDGNVYDLTDWIKQHPGGKEAILQLCGQDGTERFAGQHGEDGKPNAELAKHLIGILLLK